MVIILYRNNCGQIAIGLIALDKGKVIDIFPVIITNRSSVFEEIPNYWEISEIKLSKMRFCNIIHIEPSQIEKVIFEIEYEDFVKICDKFSYR